MGMRMGMEMRMGCLQLPAHTPPLSRQQSMQVPQTPLHTSRVLKEEKDLWEDVKVKTSLHCCLKCSAPRVPYGDASAISLQTGLIQARCEGAGSWGDLCSGGGWKNWRWDTRPLLQFVPMGAWRGTAALGVSGGWGLCRCRGFADGAACASCPQEEMTSALATMRVDYEQIKIKKIEDSSNPLLMKRRKKANPTEPATLPH